MALVSSPSSPNSLQLRLGRGAAKPSPPALFFRIRFRSSVCRPVLICAVGEDGQSWTGDGRPQDSFAGWSGSGGGDGGGSNKKKDRLGGMLGAGLAGAFFTAGIAFASISLSSRTSSGVKQQMEPLKTSQKVVLTSDKITEDDQLMGDASAVLSEQSKPEDFQTGTTKDCLSHIEIDEDSTGSGLDEIQYSEPSLNGKIEPSGNGIDVTHYASHDPQISSDGIPEPSTSSFSSADFSSNDACYFPDVSTFKDSDNTTASAPPNPATGPEPNQSITNHVDLFSGSTNSTTYSNDSQDGDVANHAIPSGFLGEFEPSPSPVVIEPANVVDLSDSTEERLNDVPPVLQDKEIEHTAVPQLAAAAGSLNTSADDVLKTVPSGKSCEAEFSQSDVLMLKMESVNYTEGRALDENGQSVGYLGEVLAGPSVNQSDKNNNSQVDTSSAFQSAIPEKALFYAGIPAPSLVCAALQVPPGKVLVPAVVDQVQGQALAALQVLKVIECDAQPGDLCTRREYARWLVSASSALSRNAVSKVYPAMYIENVTELAFDDITPQDPDYPCIQGLAEAGIISSKLSKFDVDGTPTENQDPFLFSPDSPVSRQDLVSWKMALERRQLPEVDRNFLYQRSGYIDIDKIEKGAWPALVADLSAGEQCIVALAFGYTRLFQPNKPVTKAQAAIALATGDSAEVVGEELARIEAESLAETAVNAHTALVAQVEKELNTSFEAELTKEREKTNLLEKLAEEARSEMQRLKAEREVENNALIKEQASIDSEMEVLSRLRHQVEEQLQDLMSNKVEISFERDRINKLRKEAESENQVITQLQYELEVERKALSMARVWAEEEAKRAREHARALEEARDRWERHGIKVVVDKDLQEDASTGVTWVMAGQRAPVDETISRAESLVDKLKAMVSEMKMKSSATIQNIIQKILSLISALNGMACEGSRQAMELKDGVISRVSEPINELKENAAGVSSSISDKARRAVEDCKEGVGKFTHKFRT